jgi:CheY-like chemotaxis protein
MSGERILIVDDNPSNMKLVEFILAKHGYALASAEDAERALAEVRLARPDLILLDLQLPGMDGLELARTFRADPTLAGVPIIAVTAYAMRGDEERALAAGCDAYISKPIDTRALPGIVAKLLVSGRS